MPEQNQPSSKKYLYISIAGIVMIVIIAIGVLTRGSKDGSPFSFAGRDRSDEPPSQIITKTTKDLEVTSFTLERRAGETPAQVTGTLKNNGKKTYGMPIISFGGTEASGGASLDTCLALKLDPIAAGETWDFIAVCGQNMDPTSVELIEVTYTEVQ